MTETDEGLDIARESSPPPTIDIDFESLGGFLRRRWALGVGMVLLALICVVLVTWAMPPTYCSTSLLLVEIQGPSPPTGTMAVGAGLLGLQTSHSVTTQAEIMRSPAVRDVAWEQLDQRQQDTLDPRIDIRILPDTQLIEVSAWGSDPEAAWAYAHAVTEQYIHESLQQNREEFDATADFLAERLETVNGELMEAQMDLREFREANLSFDMQAQASALVSQLSTIESELRAARTQLAARQAELEAAREATVAVGGEEFSSAELASNQLVGSIKEQLLTLKQRQVEVLQEYTPTSPEAVQIEEQIERVRQQLDEEAKKVVAQELVPVQSGIWALQAQISALESAGGEARGILSELPDQQYRLAQLELRNQTLQRTYELLSENYQQLRLTEERRLSQGRVVAPAEVPERPARPDPAVNLALGLVIGLILALGCMVGAEHLDDRLYDPREVSRIADAPVLASLPDADKTNEAVDEPGGALARGFDRLRSALTVAQDRRGFTSVVLASPVAGDGRTFIASRLARDVARSGRDTLLVDADTLGPQLAEHFDLPDEVGLSTVLAGEVGLDEAMQAVEGLELTVLTWGAADGAGGELLTTDRVRKLVPALREGFGLVLIDCGPASLAPDVQTLAHEVDAALVVACLGHSTRAEFEDLLQQLRIAGADIVGVVINRA